MTQLHLGIHSAQTESTGFIENSASDHRNRKKQGEIHKGTQHYLYVSLFHNVAAPCPRPKAHISNFSLHMLINTIWDRSIFP
jgi:hypothetical protein